MNKISITKTDGNLGRRLPEKDMYSGLLLQGVAVSGGVQLGNVYRLESIKDAEAIGIDAAYDRDNHILVYEHINEFFRINPNGVLFLMLVAQNTSINDMLTDTANSVYKLTREAGSELRQVGVGFNPSTAFSATTVTDAIGLAQSFADWTAQTDKPAVVLLEGRGVDMNNAVDLHTKNAESVAVVIGQNLQVANNPDNQQTDYAAIGTALGTVSKAKVNESIAWVAQFNLQGGHFEVPGLGGQNIDQFNEGTIGGLDDKGFLFFRTYAGYAGIYWNDSYTATALTSDYSYLENNRTMNKSIRNVRTALLPYLASPVKVDAETGKLSPEVVKQFEMVGKRALEKMVSEGELSDMEIFVDPEQDIIGTSELKVNISVIPTGTARKISVTIGFKNPV